MTIDRVSAPTLRIDRAAHVVFHCCVRHPHAGLPMIKRILKWACAIAVICGLIGGAYFTRGTWLPWVRNQKPDVAEESNQRAEPAAKVVLTDQMLQSLRLTSAPLKPDTFWNTIEVAGMIVDRPGYSDRGVVAPVTGVVMAIQRFQGETVRPGEALFTIKILGESLYQTQSDLFKAVQDIKLAKAQRKRLAASSDVIVGERLIEVDNQISRLEISERAYRQELRTRGLTAQQVESAAEGNYVTDVVVVAPPRPVADKPLLSVSAKGADGELPPSFEVQELKVELGQQVQVGQSMCILANHQMLAIEGRAFRDETPLLERTVKEGWPVEVDFQEPDGSGWKPVEQPFHIRHLSNTIDPINRTFAFLIPLDNQSRVVERGGSVQLLWRFRPGQRVRLRIRVDKLDKVFILPADAVVREGAEVFVFTQNVNTFERKLVQTLVQERQRVV